MCDPGVAIRRLVFFGYKPDNFKGKQMNVLNYNDDIIEAMSAEEKEAYIENEENYSVYNFRSKENPSDAWAVPYVTGRKYRIHWANYLDYT